MLIRPEITQLYGCQDVKKNNNNNNPDWLFVSFLSLWLGSKHQLTNQQISLSLCVSACASIVSEGYRKLLNVHFMQNAVFDASST